MPLSVWHKSVITQSPVFRCCHTCCQRRAFSISTVRTRARASSRHTPISSASARGSDRPIPRSKLIWAILLASGVTSLAINLRNARDQYNALQSHHAAQLSVLKDIIHRLENGLVINEDRQLLDYERVGLVARAQPAYSPERLTWREMLFGRRKTLEQAQAEEAETAAFERSFENASQADVEQQIHSAGPVLRKNHETFPAAPQRMATSPRPDTSSGSSNVIIV